MFFAILEDIITHFSTIGGVFAFCEGINALADSHFLPFFQIADEVAIELPHDRICFVKNVKERI